MDPFRTEVRIKPHLPIHHRMGIYTTGSCFADTLGDRLREARFICTVNPFGVSYNALSMHKLPKMVLQKEKPDPSMFVESEGSVRHLDFHSAFRARSISDLSATLMERSVEVAPSLKKARVVILTYGTSWAYRHLATGNIVNNCHKLPAREFERVFVEPSAVIESFASIHRLLNGISPGIRFILTVSPVRHLRDSLDLNQLSKAGLILACHEIVRSFSDTEYFPAYEIMMDDLRDYRFYEQDMIHPSAAAIEYIWDKFSESYFSKETSQLATRCRELDKALSHRAFDPASTEHKAFLRSTLRLAKELHQQEANVAGDIERLEQRLSAG
jgi:hypothetical protein